ARHVVDRAFRIALATRSPTCIIIPGDVQELAYKSPPHAHATVHSGSGYSEPRIVPKTADLMRAAEVLNAGEKVAILVGAGAAHGVQIDLDPRMLSLRYPMEANLTGDSRETLLELLPLLAHKKDRRWRARIERNVEDCWNTLEKRAHNDADPVNPQRFFWELSPRLPDNALLACDTGATVHWYSRDLSFRPGMQAAHSGNLASMGAAIPYAFAAK